ncbi:MAG TPA: hypothetical protein GX731_07675, partial [Clostridiales bacterium]|nr:hypothetical protein [Clostridiales bacterium]
MAIQTKVVTNVRLLAPTATKKRIGGISMNVYTSEKIRNVVVLGHGSCGKTT